MMETGNIQLGERLVGDIAGEFYIPSYQRGYRWEAAQVTALLNDIADNGDQPYCLQPVVVRKDAEGRYEVIDGQQRLTTLYIIYSYLKSVMPMVEIRYSLTYETRRENTAFFGDMENEQLAESNIDFHFIHKAYVTVKQWFERGNGGANEIISKALRFISYFNPDKMDRAKGRGVKVIWYELGNADVKEAIALFTRLNIGHIPLTNAELVKALFLCRQKGCEGELEERRQMEIALQWDTIERELHDEDFWYFLTTKEAEEYPTRIELLFDFMAGKKENERDAFATFIWFNNRRNDLPKLWEKILTYYYRLKEWYKKDELYHKIGYLVASRSFTIGQLMEAVKGLRKSEMVSLLDQKLRESIDFKKPYAELSYENNYEEISRILLLFNVVSLMDNGSGARFPFKEYNTEHWSLEHIHARNSLKLNTQKKWKEWLEHHMASVKGMMDGKNDAEVNQLLTDMSAAAENNRLTKEQFGGLSDRITRLLSETSGTTENIHSLSNMALLQTNQNSVLSNGLFDAKRRKIIEMDLKGEYIPYCTKMVFLKYYTAAQEGDVSFHFWAANDRKGYIEKMNEKLKSYLKEEIRYDGEQGL